MTTIILKVQLREEIRRVSLNVSEPMKISDLEAKVISMFPQLQDFVMMMRNPSTEDLSPIFTDEQLHAILLLVRSVRPPILRITILEGQKRPEVASVETVSSPSVRLEHAEVKVFSADEEEIVEEGDDESELEEDETVPPELTQDASADELDSEESPEPDSICSNCKGYIGEETCFEKVRFKCLNCPEVLCDYCEEQACHDPSHLLVKLRVPVEQLPLKQQIVFVSHMEDPSLRTSSRLKRKELRTALKAERRERRRQERLYAKKARKLARRAERKSARLARKQKEQDKKLAVAMFEAQEQLKEFAVVAQSLAEAVESPEEAAPQAEVVGVPEETVLPPLIESSPVSLSLPAPIVGNQEEEIEVEDLCLTDDEQESIHDDEWRVSSLMQGFEIIPPIVENSEDVPPPLTASVNLNAHRIQGLAFREKLAALETMGFGDRNKNILLLVKHLANLEGVVAELVNGS